MTRTRHATHPPAVPVMARDTVRAVAGGGGGSQQPLDGRGVRTPDDDDCQSMAHTTIPSMPLIP